MTNWSIRYVPYYWCFWLEQTWRSVEHVFLFLCRGLLLQFWPAVQNRWRRYGSAITPPVFIIRAATAGDRERHLRRKPRDNRKNDNRVGGEWVQRRKRWRGLIEERAQKLRDASDARDDGCRKRGWRTRTGEVEGRKRRESCRELTNTQGKGKGKGEAQEEVEVGKVEEGEKIQPTQAHYFSISVSNRLFSPSL